jgi:WD40 repeat protein
LGSYPYNYVTCITGLPDGRIACGYIDGTLLIFKNKLQKILGKSSWECDLILEGHSKEILCCNVLPCKNQLMSERVLPCKDKPITDRALLYLVTGSADNTLKIWNISPNGKCIMTLEGHSDWVT